ncbi:uncharacterized protein FTOL_08131 [Fusarium torulosum]|uniref:Uncharacterized protein n=1 Tax=Fusarium torulosum TaxID=33205 RepID=A0AAE8MC85_9HYPO|nr:uncharacterized protein FTOL_08131 [Fusarium torulosum]
MGLSPPPSPLLPLLSLLPLAIKPQNRLHRRRWRWRFEAISPNSP